MRSGGSPMTTVLRALLIERHLHSHAAFIAEYDRHAELIDTRLVGHGPTKTQYYRWLSGELQSLPRGHHCRVLESIFPDWTAEQLFSEDKTGQYPDIGHMSDVIAVYPNRAMLSGSRSPEAMLAGARDVSIVGLTLNLLCQQYPDRRLLELLEAGTVIRALFLDPNGRYVSLREEEEGQPEGTLKTLTALNIRSLQRVRARLPPDAPGRLEIRTYDEPPRFHILLVNNLHCIVAPYLPDRRGIDSPVFIIEQTPEVDRGLFHTFTDVFETLWAHSISAPD